GATGVSAEVRRKAGRGEGHAESRRQQNYGEVSLLTGPASRVPRRRTIERRPRRSTAPTLWAFSFTHDVSKRSSNGPPLWPVLPPPHPGPGCCRQTYRSDERWHVYAGSTRLVRGIDPKGCYSRFLLGSNPGRQEALPATVPPGNWFRVAHCRLKILGPGRMYRRSGLRFRRL